MIRFSIASVVAGAPLVWFAATSAAQDAPKPKTPEVARELPAAQDASKKEAPASRPTSPDVPVGSSDPVVDGLKAVFRDMVSKGFAEDAEAALSKRLRSIFDVAELGGPDEREREALASAKWLLSVQRDYRPKTAGDAERPLTREDDLRVRSLAEATARDLRRRLTPKATVRPTSADVPEWSKDPMLDGMKSIVRELIRKGFAEAEKEALATRLRTIYEIADVGDETSRRREADSLALTLLEIQRDYGPRNSPDPNRALTQDEEMRIRVMAEALARDLYRRLPKVGADPSGAHGGDGSHTGAFRAAPVLKPPPGYEVVTWKTIGGFEYTEGMKLPDDVLALHGKKVAVAGYMMTFSEVENIRHFLLVESLWSCCFGVPPNVNQVYEVKIAGPRGVEYSSLPVMLLGTLEVGERIEDGFVTSVYRLKLDGPDGVKPVE
jgi:hypothetical protein